MRFAETPIDPELKRLLKQAKEPTAEELEQQRQSWMRANKPTGDPRFD